MYKRAMAMLLIILAVVLAGCGGSHPLGHPLGGVKATGSTLKNQCPANKGHMGCAIAQPKDGLKLPSSLAPSGPLFPDVYEGQGNVNWGAVKQWQVSHGWPTVAVYKLGEFRVDFKAATNASQTKTLGFKFRGGYWFVRNTGCAHEASQIVAEGRTTATHFIILDAEVPEAAGYVGCLTGPVRKAGFFVLVYTAPGTWPGGANLGLPLWMAEYGPNFSLCIRLWTCNLVGWQFTDGVFGSPTRVPGIGGLDDVSLNKGIDKLAGPPPPPPDPIAYMPKPQVSVGGLKLSEHNTASTWIKFKCLNPVKRDVCKSTHYHLQLLDGRVVFLATHKLVNGKWVGTKPHWSDPNSQIPFGSRHALMSSQLAQKK